MIIDAAALREALAAADTTWTDWDGRAGHNEAVMTAKERNDPITREDFGRHNHRSEQRLQLILAAARAHLQMLENPS